MEEKRLWLGVLIQAMKDLGGHGIAAHASRREQIRRVAWAWFCSDDEEAGSFQWICAGLGLSPTYLRARLFRMMSRPSEHRLRITAAKL
jgi:hypothetical protein